ncbi:nitrogen assimilation transcription factor nirA, putative [Talaromyces stipitatus ATCC 10500]|uniref:Nitrogen assimilation transcription factor nirA, putative n=1 Tax=Talaromyces stipitatus (strain ATCC 10500 / CBS 375.48 / QM 6759 / NRRL 1006) TaxID=441959 RepID=B8ML82_TALSN|nr:nitrogen assimilation transcription factor nirA, putative [Talaromyces stipitatus ATCC 10500]EED14997.1 nitrogen assimilation transcription factor nirA, putative [Talaromyces stipitatus ATCC 10500]
MTSDSSPTVSTNKRKKRVGTACDFCRQRKLGCDNAKPKCENCRCSGKDCTYAERVKKIRPTNAQIRHLEDENAQLKSSLSKLRSRLNQVEQSNDAGDDSHHVNHRDPMRPTVSTRLTQQTIQSSRPNQPYYSTADREVQFHGPSSALFDESHQQPPASNRNVCVNPAKKYEILGSCIKQRQMEPIDLAAGRLDFDGVDPEVGMHLLSIFWNRQHASGLLVYRPAFMRDMACDGPYFSKLLLNAIFFSASKNSPRTEFRCSGAVTDEPTAISPFRVRAEELLSMSTSGLPTRTKSDITTIQALLIMSDALFAWCDERSLSWLYSGLAINMLVDLGIHTDRRAPAMNKTITTEYLEIRRRLFWAAFVQDKVQSIFQGRPARLREADVNVPISFMDDYEELEQFTSLSYAQTELNLSFPTRSVSVFQQLCKLSIIMDRIISGIYAENCSLKSTSKLLDTACSLHQDLKDWRKSLPEHLNMDFDNTKTPPLTPHALSLMSMYYSLIILLHRPFVSDGHINASSASVIWDAFTTCAAAASGIDAVLRVFLQHFCITTVPYFMSYATYVSGTIHVRIAAQSGRNSEAYKSLQSCLDILSQQQSICRAPRRARRILLGLAKRLNVDIDESPTSVEEARPAMLRENAPVVPSINADFNTSTLQNQQSDFDLLMSGLDIDAIIQSFDFDHSNMMNSAISNGHLDILPVTERETGMNTDLVSSQNTDDFSEWMFQDPLFGYDSLFPFDDSANY